MINPPPRPALRKAPDADVHPVAPVPSVAFPSPLSDTLVSRTPKKNKRATVEVKVPKHVAKSAKQLAKVRGERLDDVVSAALQAYVDGG